MTTPMEANQSLLERASAVGLQDSETQKLFGGERDFVELSSRETSFAGMFLEGGVLVVTVTDLDRGATVVSDVQGGVLPEIQQRGRALGGLEVRKVEYSFLELANWRNLAFRHVMWFEDVTSLDLDERRNRVSIGLATGSGRAQVLEVLKDLDVPLEAVAIAVTGSVNPGVLNKKPEPAPPLRAATNLYDRVRPIPGGVKFVVSNPSYSTNCTMGFNARSWPSGTYRFITNSHCTYDLFDLDQGITKAVQVSAPDTIGLEAVDPDGWTCGLPGFRRVCRYSDAAAYSYYASVIDSVDFGAIARPEGPPGTGSSSGSTTIDSIRPRFYIKGSVNWPISGDSAHKVGLKTGWT
ncbi:MAG: hypothetical protein KJN92_08540, partial [Gemmatimonadetes bacterium]|nr:hypothetical protein [Gemmatimonadota bacterium]